MDTYTITYVKKCILLSGLGSTTIPLYLSECVVASYRAPLVICYQYAITLGMMVNILRRPDNWRVQIALAMIPLAIETVGIQCLPESPSWLSANGMEEEANQVISCLNMSNVSNDINEKEENDHNLKSKKSKYFLEFFALFWLLVIC